MYSTSLVKEYLLSLGLFLTYDGRVGVVSRNRQISVTLIKGLLIAAAYLLASNFFKVHLHLLMQFVIYKHLIFGINLYFVVFSKFFNLKSVK